MSMDLADNTKRCYMTAVEQYKGFMESRGKNPENPQVRDLCLWIAEESLFVKAESICKYWAGVKYYLDTYEAGHIARHILVKRVVRGLCKKYGLAKRDQREPITMELILQILKLVNLKDHDERCYAAACVIGFLHCLRIGEFTLTGKSDRFLKRSDWTQSADKGCIKLRRCKTDLFGRGHELRYCKMASILNPVFWMGNYASKHASWTNKKDEALFMLEDGSTLSRSKRIEWFRKKARKQIQMSTN
jgi:hypothetical protein